MHEFPHVKRFDHPTLEQEILDWWQRERIFEKSVEDRPGAPAFTFYEGPPTANGRPGIHHVMARTIKDAFCRYKTLKGYRVARKAGWDTHGLPVEIEVEKKLGLEGRHQVDGPGGIGIEAYNRACRENVQQYTAQWNELTQRMGYWVDLGDPYVTFHNTYIESVWWLLKTMYDKDLLYEGYKIQWYSPGTGTVLSSHEVSLGYKEVQDPSVYVRFPVVGEENTSFLAWTTTPWTLISNTALAVGPKIPYVRIKKATEEGHEFLYLAEARLAAIKEDYEVVETLKGADLVGKTYAPPFGYFVDEHGADAAWRVVSADFVTTEDGTGIVHLAPAFGADDYTVGQRESFPLINPVAPDGTFTDAAPLVAGQWFKDADKTIVRDLRERGLLYRHDSYLHNYPHDWRKGTPLMMYPVESWFVRTTAYKDKLIALNETINWQPEGIGQGRFGEWLRGNVDWALSRKRFWGTPLPIWQSESGDHVECVGSIDELRDKVGGTFPPEAINPETGEIDLHRPYVDAITWTAPDGSTMRRVPDLIDVWFDSGAMPFAQWHYPFENEEKFQENFPADFIAEGVDQTRGWFYTLHAIATLVMDSVAYKNVVVNGLVLDENGEKMSKSKGNAVDPFVILPEYGADVVRWYMMSNAPPWENLRFSERGLQETLRKFFGTLENTYAFFATYANIDAPDFGAPPVPVEQRPELDRWILSRLATATRAVDDALDAYNPTKAARAVEAFVDELSNWYIRRNRRRFWKSGETKDKLAAYQTVHQCLTTVAVLMAPIAPFFAEWLYRTLAEATPERAAESVHLAPFPDVDERVIDLDLERRMALARTVSSLVLGLRNEAGINVRQPLARVLVVLGPGVEKRDVEAVRAIVLDEVNVKGVEYVGAASDFVERRVAPNFRVLGKKLGAAMKNAKARIDAMTDDEISAFVQHGAVTLGVDGQDVTFEGDDLVVTSEGVPGWLVATDGPVTVALDTTLTPELAQEGLAREAVNRIQNLRKSAGLDVTDRIAITYEASPQMAAALAAHAAHVRNETLAVELSAGVPQGVSERFDVGEETLYIGLEPVA